MAENLPVDTTKAKQFEAAKEFLFRKDIQQELARAAGKFTTPERIARLAYSCILENPKIAECFLTAQGRASVSKALLTATQRGLEFDGQEAYLVPFARNLPGGQSYMSVQMIAGYQGLIKLAYNHPRVESIHAQVVFEKDRFAYIQGDEPSIQHVPTEDDDPGKLRAAYAVARIQGGGVVRAVLWPRDIKRIRASSKGAHKPDSIWNINEPSMWMKSAVRQVLKMVPRSPELASAIAEDNEAEGSDIIDVGPSNTVTALFGENAAQLAEGDAQASLPEPAAPAAPAEAQPAKATDPDPEPKLTNRPLRRSAVKKPKTMFPRDEPKEDADDDHGVMTVTMGSDTGKPKHPLEAMVDRMGWSWEGFITHPDVVTAMNGAVADSWDKLPLDVVKAILGHEDLMQELIDTSPSKK